MNKRKIAMGPGAASIILIVVTLSLCMLAMLTMLSSRNDLNLSTRSASMIEQVYTLSDRSERTYAELDEILARCRAENTDDEAYLAAVEEQLPEGAELEGDVILWTEPLDNRTLECAVRVLPLENENRAEWVSHKLVVDEPEDDWEWN